MKYILVTVNDGEIDTILGFDDLKKAKAQADEDVSYFDLDHAPGDVAIFEVDPKTGRSNEVYRPEIPCSDDDVEDSDIE